MLEDLKRELLDLSKKVNREKKVISMLENVENEELRLVQKENDLKEILKKEDKDVDRMERTSVTSVFYSIIGKKEEKMEKEQQEAYAAKLKYDAAVIQLEDCRRQIDELYRELESLTGCKENYEKVFNKIKRELRTDLNYSEKMIGLERQLEDIKIQLKEISEAECVGFSCMEHIREIENRLNSADSWGTWDLVGGGLLTDMAKHSNLNNAQIEAEQLQVLLRRFRTELADVKINTQIDPLNIEGFLYFADYFFDGLIADWCVLSRINKSQESVSELKMQVKKVMEKLENISYEEKNKKEKIEKKINDMVYSI